MGNTHVALINPPFFDIHRPSIALGILKSILQNDGVNVSVDYANMWYSEHAGLDAYQRISLSRPEHALGDWIFGAAAFPEFSPDHAAYLNKLLAVRTDLKSQIGGDPRSWLMQLRLAATTFIQTAAERIMAKQPRIVGCSSTFTQHAAALALLREIQARDPSIVTIMGGANCESIMGKTTHRNFLWVDYVVSGEAEDLIVALCRGALEHGRDMPIEQIPYGVFAPAHRQLGYPTISVGDGVPRAFVKDIDTIPIPDYRDFFAEVDRSTYKAGLIPNVLIESSRGCWWGQVSHCTFCGLNGNGMAFRQKKAQRVLAEMDELVRRHDVFRIEAVDNILDFRYFESLLPKLADSQRHYSIFYETKSNLTRSQVELLVSAGVRVVQPGIESLDTRVLKLMKKGVAAWQNVRLLKWARKFGLRLQWSTIYGFPGERDEWYEETSRLVPKLFHLQPGGTHRLRYDRFSPYHQRPSSFGLDLVPNELHQYVFPLTSADRTDQAYFFVDTNCPSEEHEADSLRDRPGLSALIAACDRWMSAWKQMFKPICVLYERDSRIWLKDTRPGLGPVDRELSDIAVDLLHEADDGIAIRELVPKLTDAHGWLAADVEAELQSLTDAGLILALDNRALSLPLRAPIQHQPRLGQLPFGTVIVPRMTEANIQPRVACE